MTRLALGIWVCGLPPTELVIHLSSTFSSFNRPQWREKDYGSQKVVKFETSWGCRFFNRKKTRGIVIIIAPIKVKIFLFHDYPREMINCCCLKSCATRETGNKRPGDQSHWFGEGESWSFCNSQFLGINSAQHRQMFMCFSLLFLWRRNIHDSMARTASK